MAPTKMLLLKYVGMGPNEKISLKFKIIFTRWMLISHMCGHSTTYVVRWWCLKEEVKFMSFDLQIKKQIIYE